jgi:signal transduction histidine kinase/CheY-like chemotaxis protein
MRAYVHGARANPPHVVALILIGVVYFGLARLSLLLAFESTNASPVWPPSGFALTVLLAVGRRAWPALAVGAWIANAVTFVTNGAPLGAGVLLASFAIALGNASEAILAEAILRRLCRPERSAFLRAATFVLGAALSSALAAGVGACTVVLGGFAPRALTESIFAIWWIGDSVGMLLLTPLFLSFLPLPNELIRVGRVMPTLVATASAGAIWLIAHKSASGSDDLNRSLIYVQAGVAAACLLSLALGAARDRESPERSAARIERALRLVNLGARGSDEVSSVLAPVLAGLGVLATSLALWRTVLGDQRVALMSATQAASDSVVLALESELRAQSRAVERLARRGQHRRVVDESQWRETVRAFISDFPGFEALEWIDDEHDARYREALVDARPIQISASERAELARVPGKSVAFFREPSVREPEPLIVFAVLCAREPSQRGLMLGSVRLREAFERARQHHVPDFGVRLRQGNGIVLGALDGTGRDQSTVQRAHIPGYAPGIEVEVRASPRKARTLRSALPEVILGGGSMLSAMVAALLFLAQEVRNRERKVRSDGERLLRMNQELAEERQRAEAAARAKSEFLANMSHELRTPMSAVVGLSTLLRQTELSAVQLEYVNDLELSSNLLRQLIDDILDMSKLDAGKVELEQTSFSPRAHLEKLVQLVSRNANEKGLSLELDVEASLPLWFVGDPLRIAQVLLNLLSNAVKFTERGYVRVRATGWTSSNGESAELRYEISDSGAGIDAATLERLFAPFAQADASTTRRFGGTGLGLYISRSLAQLMRAELSCDSEPGRGTTFRFELKGAAGTPLVAALPSSRALRIAPARRTTPARILVAEDNAVNRKIAVRLLESLGYEAEVAHDGLAAVAAVKSGNFDLVLMDWQMPIMDGLQATAAIRAEGRQLPIVALTANAMEGDRERCLAAGMNDYLAKPLGIEALGAMLERLLPRNPSQREHVHGVSAKQ